MDPLTLSSLINVGSSFAESGMKGIGAGISAGRLAELEKEKERQRQLEAERQFMEQRRQFGIGSGMQGIEMLSQMRDRATKSNLGRVFRNKLLAAVGGA